MKKQLLITIAILISIFNYGCANYDYQKDIPLGAMGSDSIEFEEDIVSNVNYDGSFVVANSNQNMLDKPDYSDDNISIIKIEQRLNRALILFYVNSKNVFDDFIFDIAYYDEFGQELGSYSSEPQMVLGNMYNEIIIECPIESASFRIISYCANNIGELKSLKIKSVNDDNVCKKSTTTFQIECDDSIFMFKDGNIVVWGEAYLKAGDFVVGRNGITHYGKWEVK